MESIWIWQIFTLSLKLMEMLQMKSVTNLCWIPGLNFQKVIINLLTFIYGKLANWGPALPGKNLMRGPIKI